MMALTIIMKSKDFNRESSPSRDREYSRLTGFVSDDKTSILGAVLWNRRYLGSSPTKISSSPEVFVVATYGREHPQGFV